LPLKLANSAVRSPLPPLFPTYFVVSLHFYLFILDWVDGYKSTLQSLSGDLKSQQVTISEHIAGLEQGIPSLESLQALNDQINNAGIESNEYTALSFEELQATFNEVKLNAQKKLAFIEGQITIIEMQKIPESQLEEYKASFVRFDKDKSGMLQSKEFQAALQSIGIRLSDDELTLLMQSFGTDEKGEPSVSFDEYVSFLVERTQDKDSPEQVAAAFKLLAKDKESITEADLAPYIAADHLQWLINNAPKKEDGTVDFTKFVSESFNQ